MQTQQVCHSWISVCSLTHLKFLLQEYSSPNFPGLQAEENLTCRQDGQILNLSFILYQIVIPTGGDAIKISPKNNELQSYEPYKSTRIIYGVVQYVLTSEMQMHTSNQQD